MNKELGQFAFDGKLVKDATNENSAVATAYLPTGEYQFEIATGIEGLGESNGQFTLNQKKVNADEAGTEIVVLNEMQAFEGVLDLSQAISHSRNREEIWSFRIIRRRQIRPGAR